MTTATPTDLPEQGSDVEDDDEQTSGRSSATRSITEWGIVIVGAVLAALLIKTFIMQAFFIPSSSMEQTLLVDDRVLVNKLAYRFGEVQHDDIIVFHRPSGTAAGPDEIDELIKRVIGLPGDSIVIGTSGKVVRNGETLDEPYLSPGVTTTNGSMPCTVPEPCVVPQDSLFVMGDNRPNSHDSRYIGYIPEENVVGKAFVRVWPLNRLGSP